MKKEISPDILTIQLILLSKIKQSFLTEFVGEIMCPNKITGGKIEVTRYKLIREVLDRITYLYS